MADVTWERFETVEVGGRPDDGWIEFRGRPLGYPVRDERRTIARDLVALADGGTTGRAVEFARRWGPLHVPDMDAYDPADMANGWHRDGRRGWHLVAPISNTLKLAEFMARLRREAQAADGPARSRAERSLVGIVRETGLDFAPGGGLVPQLVPQDLKQVVAIAVLEEVRAVTPVLWCLNYPSPGCERDVKPREGDEQRGRRRLYCSERCADRARSKRKYARRRAGKESTS